MVWGNFGKIRLSVEICSSVVAKISISLLLIPLTIAVRPKSKYSDFFSYHRRHYLIYITVLNVLHTSILIFILRVSVFEFC